MIDAAELRRISQTTLAHYDAGAESFWAGTRDHDVSQNIAALLTHLGPGSFRILDLGCGPGRDLLKLRELGQQPVGLDGSERFVAMARAHSGAPVLHQDFLALDLPAEAFDGVFANASLFHVPRQELGRVLGELHRALRPGGVLFASNPHGQNQEGWQGRRYGTYLDLEAWTAHAEQAGFRLLDHYYRPTGLPRAQQPWLATVFRRTEGR